MSGHATGETGQPGESRVVGLMAALETAVNEAKAAARRAPDPSEKAHLGTWVGLDQEGVIVAGSSVMAPEDEGHCMAFVADGTRAVLRVPPGVTVCLGEPVASLFGSNGDLS